MCLFLSLSLLPPLSLSATVSLFLLSLSPLSLSPRLSFILRHIPLITAPCRPHSPPLSLLFLSLCLPFQSPSSLPPPPHPYFGGLHKKDVSVPLSLSPPSRSSSLTPLLLLFLPLSPSTPPSLSLSVSLSSRSPPLSLPLYLSPFLSFCILLSLCLSLLRFLSPSPSLPPSPPSLTFPISLSLYPPLCVPLLLPLSALPGPSLGRRALEWVCGVERGSRTSSAATHSVQQQDMVSIKQKPRWKLVSNLLSISLALSATFLLVFFR